MFLLYLMRPKRITFYYLIARLLSLPPVELQDSHLFTIRTGGMTTSQSVSSFASSHVTDNSRRSLISNASNPILSPVRSSVAKLPVSTALSNAPRATLSISSVESSEPTSRISDFGDDHFDHRFYSAHSRSSAESHEDGFAVGNMSMISKHSLAESVNDEWI